MDFIFVLPRVFFLYLTVLFHVNFFSCPIGISKIGYYFVPGESSICSYPHLCVCCQHCSVQIYITWYSYHYALLLKSNELRALYAGLIAPQSLCMARLGMDRGKVTGEGNRVIVSLPWSRIHPLLFLQRLTLQHQKAPLIERFLLCGMVEIEVTLASPECIQPCPIWHHEVLWMAEAQFHHKPEYGQ